MTVLVISNKKKYRFRVLAKSSVLELEEIFVVKCSKRTPYALTVQLRLVELLSISKTV